MTATHTAAHRGTLPLQHTATHCNTLCESLCMKEYHHQEDHKAMTATNGNTLQHAVTRCNIRQHTALHCITLQHTICGSVYQRVTSSTEARSNDSNALQHATALCNTLQHSATHTTHRVWECVSKSNLIKRSQKYWLQLTAVHCNTL